MLRQTQKYKIYWNRPISSAFTASQRNPRWPPFCHKTAFIFPYVHKFHILMQNEILLKKRGLKMCHTCMFASQNTDLLQKYCNKSYIFEFVSACCKEWYQIWLYIFKNGKKHFFTKCFKRPFWILKRCRPKGGQQPIFFTYSWIIYKKGTFERQCAFVGHILKINIHPYSYFG